MSSEKIRTLDINILVSLINMKLRNDFDSLQRLVAFYDADMQILYRRLVAAGYIYQIGINQIKLH